MRQNAALIAAMAVSLLGVSVFARIASAAEGILPDEWQGIRTAPLLLLSRADVRAELRLDAAQTAAVEQAIVDLRGRAAALRGKTGPGTVEARKAIDQAQFAWIERNLTEGQRGRLAQIDLQWEGPSALISRPIVADHLRLTDTQRAALRQAVIEYRNKRFAGAAGPQATRELDLRAMAVLSPGQKSLWQAMLGDRFSVPSQAVAQNRATKPPVDPGVRRTGHAQP